MPKSLFQQLVEQTCQQAKSSNQNAKPAAASQPAVSESRKVQIAAALEYAERAPRCQHIKANGVRCKSPAMREQPFCFFHEKFYNAPFDDTFPPLEDANSVQCAILQVLNGLKSKIITLPEARVLLYGLKAASINARRTNFDAPRAFESQVTEYPNAVHTKAATAATAVAAAAAARTAARASDAQAREEFLREAKEQSAAAASPVKIEVVMPKAAAPIEGPAVRKPATPEVIPSKRAARVEGSGLTSH